jgi:hypothetical protein
MKWTSMSMPDWASHCENLWQGGESFELRDVTTPERNGLVQMFAVRHGAAFSREGTTVLFFPPPHAFTRHAR